MCGIVGAAAERNVVPVLMEGLRRLEYRGYDSAGIAVQAEADIKRHRALGKVEALEQLLEQQPLQGATGIAHTRWASHGAPSEANAHPHVSGPDIAIVHNGIIENHEQLRDDLESRGYEFVSETDTEVIAHRVHMHLQTSGNLETAVRLTVAELHGAYALVVMNKNDPGKLVLARQGCPVVVGLGVAENFVASDIAALLPVTRRFMFLEEGDLAVVTRTAVVIADADGNPAVRSVTESAMNAEAAEKGPFRHFMEKEIHEQPRAVAETLEGRIVDGRVVDAVLGPQAAAILDQVEHVHIVACGTSYHAGLVARYWIEEYCALHCTVEIASEYRYRRVVVPDNTLFITVSQSGETADTLAALSKAKDIGYVATLAICNVPESALVRESELVMMTRAGPEISVASTKAFTTQLAAFGLVTMALARHRGLPEDRERDLTTQLQELPALLEQMLALDPAVEKLAARFIEKHNALFLGRGALNATAMEGALKLKEISYIHAEAYAAGELKHGPLALVDEGMPVVVIAANDELLEKLKSNLQEVRARGGQLYVFTDSRAHFTGGEGWHVMQMPVQIREFQAPVLYAVPLQLLAYHVAVLKGTDADKPRNLAKTVTVE